MIVILLLFYFDLKIYSTNNAPNICIPSTYYRYPKQTNGATEKVSVLVKLTNCKPQCKIKYRQQKQKFGISYK